MTKEVSYSFKKFHGLASYIYRYLCVTPTLKSVEDGDPKLQPMAAVFFLTLLVCYWIGVLASFLRRDLQNSTISIVSNYIQILLMSIALSTVIINTLWKFRTYNSIVSTLDAIDNLLADIKQRINYEKHLQQFHGVASGFLSLILLMNIYHGYVSVFRYRAETIYYWLLHSIPLVFYATAIHQATFFFFCCYIRMQMVLELLGVIKLKGLSGKEIPELALFTKTFPVKDNSEEMMAKLSQILSQFFVLCDQINVYYGPVFLTSLAAFFGITSIQSFYCFSIASDFEEAMGRSLWTLFTCINIVVVNLALVVMLTCGSEFVSKAANKIQVIILQVDNAQNLDSNTHWLYNMLARIRFTALGFFNINYNSLFGFISALVTYLVILIQFNAISSDRHAKLATTSTHQQTQTQTYQSSYKSSD